MSTGDRSDRRPKEPREPCHSPGAHSHENTKIAVKLLESFNLELDYFKKIATSLLRQSINYLTSFRHGPTSRTWEENQAEIKNLFTNLKKTLSDVVSFHDPDDGTEHSLSETLLRKIDESPVIAQRIERLINDTFDLAQRILTTTHTSMRAQAEEDGTCSTVEYQESYDQNIDRIATIRAAAKVSLRLFYDRDSNNPPINLLDLLAGCSFSGFCVLPHSGTSVSHGANQSHQLAMRSQSAASGVSIALSCVADTFERLFETCLESRLTLDESALVQCGCATQGTVNIFEAMCRGSDDPFIGALHGIAAEARPLRAYEVDGGVVVSFLLPQRCSVFDEVIKKSLGSVLAVYQETFDTLQIQAKMCTSEEQGWYEVGVHLQIKTEKRQTNTLSETRHLITRLSREAYDVDPNPISFWIQDEGSTCEYGVRASVPRGFFDSGYDGERLDPNPRLFFVSEALQSAQQLFGDGAEMFFEMAINPDDNLHPDDYMYVTKDDSLFSQPLRDGGLEEIAKEAEYLSTNPRTTRVPTLREGLEPIFICTAEWFKSEALTAELKSLATRVTINRINLFDFQNFVVDGTPEEGARVLRNLRDILELSQEPLEPFEKPRLTICDSYETAQGQIATPFYLITEHLDLCGFGRLHADTAEPAIRILPEHIVDKFGELVDGIMESQEVAESWSGPWAMRLQTELSERNFGLSERIVNSLRLYRAGLQQEISIEAVTRIICGMIARSDDYIISEKLRLKDREPFILAIITTQDLHLWGVEPTKSP